MGTLARFGDWALITGASAGIGQEFARQLAAEGMHLVIVARRTDRLDTLAAELTQAHGVQVRPVSLDLTADDAVDALVAATADIEVGLLINNAGFGDAGRFWRREPALLTRALLPGMIERKRGAIITVASVLALFPVPYETTYAATKAFDLSFGEALAHELKATGVVSMVLCPSLTATEMIVAEGFDEAIATKVYRYADPPAKVVRIALRSLGRKRTAGPRDYHIVSWVVRLSHRSVLSRVAAAIMRKDYLSLGR
jgi:short-subunit dehydrogenase